MTSHYNPAPLLDTMDQLSSQQLPKNINLPYAKKDFDIIKDFLNQYLGSQDTFNTYRRELERLAQWAWFVSDKSVLDLKRLDIEEYILFCQKPPKSWIGTKKTTRFVEKNGVRVANPNWRMFVATVSKADRCKGKSPSKRNYVFSQQALQSLFIVLGSFYNYLIREDMTEANPITQIRQKSRFLRKHQGKRPIRRLTDVQWKYIIKTATSLADNSPIKHERTLFVIVALYLMYLRISELVDSPRWQPKMGDFYQDSQSRWWFKTVGKGNKERDISVSDAMLRALKRYRNSRDLSPTLPTPGETTPLIHKLIGKGGVTSTREIRYLVQDCFDVAIENLIRDGLKEEANSLEVATTHWLRHTGISDDINKLGRPVAHVRDDAGHTNSATTDLYNDSDLDARHRSAKLKNIT